MVEKMLFIKSEEREEVVYLPARAVEDLKIKTKNQNILEFQTQDRVVLETTTTLIESVINEYKRQPVRIKKLIASIDVHPHAKRFDVYYRKDVLSDQILFYSLVESHRLQLEEQLITAEPIKHKRDGWTIYYPQLPYK